MSVKLYSIRAALIAICLVVGLTAVAPAQTIIVTEFADVPVDPADLVSGTWYDWFTTNTGAASVESLTGLGGNLENNQPLPTGAGYLTTEFDNADRANVGVYDTVGAPGDVFSTLEIDYWFHKAANAGQNLNAAAALKLEIYNDTCDDPASAGDCYGVLVYEPYVNGFGNFPTLDTWMLASITPDSGGFWWTGGFGQPNSAGGPPYNTLNQWLGLMSSDFQDATVVTLQIGVGSYNQGQRAYFDDVQIRHDFGAGMNVQYDFQKASLQNIDVRPKSERNQVNTNAKQLVPIAILGSADFDPVSEVDPDSLMARGTSPIGTKTSSDDVNGDGFADLTVYFRARDLAKPSAEECEDPEAVLELTGVTISGEPFTGSDFVDWQGPDCNI